MPEKDEGLALTLPEVDGLMIGKGKPARPMYEVIEPYLEAQLAKAKPIIEKQGFAKGIEHYRRVILPVMIKEAVKQEREKIAGIISDWDEMSKIVDDGETWRAKYGCYLEELLLVIRQALKEE